MRLLNVSARAHPEGNRVDLAWVNPTPIPDGYRLQIVRRLGGYPTTPEDGTVITPPADAITHSDGDLHGETMYYYTFFPSSNTTQAQLDPHNRAAAMATSPYGLGGLMYGLLPEIYRRYDIATVLRSDDTARQHLDPDDQDCGLLRRFLDLPGGQLDQLYSLARAALRLHDVAELDGALLPLLAQWIGWRTDHSATLAAQRNEIRFAPALYRRTGTAAAVVATTSRLTRRPCRIKEYVHNVARTNAPARLNLWTLARAEGGAWGTPQLLSVNFAYDGAATAVRQPDGSTLLLYHTYRRHGWDIWAKRLTTAGWSPSEPVVDRSGVDKHPAAAVAGDTQWLFWQSSGPPGAAGERQWRIVFRTRPTQPGAATAPWSDPDTERRAPAAVTDDSGGLWLFWRQRADDGWQTRYNRHDGTRWQLDEAGLLPTDDTQTPTQDDDLALLFHPGAGMPRLWLAWARRQRGIAPAGDSWIMVYRTKNGLDPADDDWSPESVVPKPQTGTHDREPAMLATAAGIELFFSSTRTGGWSIFTSRLDHAAGSWSAAEPVVRSPFSDRAPTVIDIDDATVLVYRSNQSLRYANGSDIATAATLDSRYGGTTTVDTAAAAKIALRGTFEDFQTYTYDTRVGRRRGTTPSTRDTVGVDLQAPPDGVDPDAAHAATVRLAAVLPEYLPITTRAVILDDATRP
jgi:Phage tail protein (Tail_P2_I)